MTLDDVLARFESRKAIAGGFMVRCPAHEDRMASLAVSLGEGGKILLHCHAGCTVNAIVSALGLTLSDLFPDDPHESASPETPYDYRDAAGELRYQSVRFYKDGKKTFRQRRPDGHGSWIWSMKGVDRLCYRLNQLQGREVVLIPEGEKDADRLWSIGLAATTNSGGAGKWTDDLTKQLVAAGIKRVVVLADNDAPGEAHAVQVARSCADADLFVKRILLPDLPPKGDVSDWLNAGHTKQELLAVIKNAPPFNPAASVAQKPKLELTSLADLLAEPNEQTEWLVEERVPSGSLILLAGKPKAGKSTLARYLAYCVAAGEPWLGHHVVMGPVWYLALEDKRSEFKKHFEAMGATGQEPLFALIGQAPERCLELLEARAKIEKPVLIVVDTLQRLIATEDINNYAEVTTKMAPLLKLVRETGAALVAVHHAKKFGEGADAVLGSSALLGSVDNLIIYSRGERDRTVSTIQRIGDDLEPQVILMDRDTGHLRLAGSKIEADTDRAADLILEALRDEPEAQSERWLREQVEAAPRVQARALRMMLRRGWVYRVGEGRRGNPYLYGVDAQSPRSVLPEKPAKPEKPQKPVRRGQGGYPTENAGHVETTLFSEGAEGPTSGNQQNPLPHENQKYQLASPPSTCTVRTRSTADGECAAASALIPPPTRRNGNGHGHSSTEAPSFASLADDLDDSLYANPEDEEAL